MVDRTRRPRREERPKVGDERRAPKPSLGSLESTGSINGVQNLEAGLVLPCEVIGLINTFVIELSGAPRTRSKYKQEIGCGPQASTTTGISTKKEEKASANEEPREQEDKRTRRAQQRTTLGGETPGHKGERASYGEKYVLKGVPNSLRVYSSECGVITSIVVSAVDAACSLVLEVDTVVRRWGVKKERKRGIWKERLESACRLKKEGEAHHRYRQLLKRWHQPLKSCGSLRRAGNWRRNMRKENEGYSQKAHDVEVAVEHERRTNDDLRRFVSKIAPNLTQRTESRPKGIGSCGRKFLEVRDLAGLPNFVFLDQIPENGLGFLPRLLGREHIPYDLLCHRTRRETEKVPIDPLDGGKELVGIKIIWQQDCPAELRQRGDNNHGDDGRIYVVRVYEPYDVFAHASEDSDNKEACKVSRKANQQEFGVMRAMCEDVRLDNASVRRGIGHSCKPSAPEIFFHH
ncbi:hypothetical protein C8R43DRAFT_951382 [Mycena crocata]|nr:hypothetical protein C8R43DRAFT_951382 [Mycena crocata]